MSNLDKNTNYKIMPSVTKRGDLWLLKEHRLLCGDCTKFDDVNYLLNNKSYDLLITNPPCPSEKLDNNWLALLQNFSKVALKFKANNSQWLINMKQIKKHKEVILYYVPYLNYMSESGYPLFNWYVWDKGVPFSLVCGSGLPLAHEWLFHFSFGFRRANKTVPIKWLKKNNKHKNKRLQYSVFSNLEENNFVYPKGLKVINLHPDRYSYKLPLEIAKIWTNRGQIVYDPFAGVCSTMLGVDYIGRKSCCMEISPLYIDLVLRQWRDFLKVEAILESNGKTFSEVEAQRSS